MQVPYLNCNHNEDNNDNNDNKYRSKSNHDNNNNKNSSNNNSNNINDNNNSNYMNNDNNNDNNSDNNINDYVRQELSFTTSSSPPISLSILLPPCFSFSMYFCFCIRSLGARVHSNSWGSFFSGNGYYAAADVDDYLYKHPVRSILMIIFL